MELSKRPVSWSRPHRGRNSGLKRLDSWGSVENTVYDSSMPAATRGIRNPLPRSLRALRNSRCLTGPPVSMLCISSISSIRVPTSASIFFTVRNRSAALAVSL